MRAFCSRGMDKLSFRADFRNRYNHASLRSPRQASQHPSAQAPSERESTFASANNARGRQLRSAPVARAVRRRGAGRGRGGLRRAAHRDRHRYRKPDRAGPAVAAARDRLRQIVSAARRRDCRGRRRRHARLAEQATAALAQRLAGNTTAFHSLRRPDGGPFFNRAGLLFAPAEEVARTTQQIIAAQPLLGTLAADPSLRGVMDALSLVLEGVRRGQIKLDDLARPLAAFADAIEAINAGQVPRFSWRTLIMGRAPDPRELRRFILVQPMLDFGALAARRARRGGDSRRGARDGIRRRPARSRPAHRSRAARRRGVLDARRRRRPQRDRDDAGGHCSAVGGASLRTPDRSPSCSACWSAWRSPQRSDSSSITPST